MDEPLMLDVCYDFSHKELGITFPSEQQAQQYQERNREARILADKNNVVWIPIPYEMTKIRASSSNGFVMCFRSADDASRWCDRVVLGAPYGAQGRHGKDVYIVRYWSENDLNSRLTGKFKQSAVSDRTVRRGSGRKRTVKAAEQVGKEGMSLGPPARVSSRRASSTRKSKR